MGFIYERKKEKQQLKLGEEFSGGKFNSFESIFAALFLRVGRKISLPSKNRQAPLYKIPLGFEIAFRPVDPSGGAVKLPGPWEATNGVIQLDKKALRCFLTCGDSWGLLRGQGSQIYRAPSPPDCAQGLQRVWSSVRSCLAPTGAPLAIRATAWGVLEPGLNSHSPAFASPCAAFSNK